MKIYRDEGSLCEGGCNEGYECRFFEQDVHVCVNKLRLVRKGKTCTALHQGDCLKGLRCKVKIKGDILGICV